MDKGTKEEIRLSGGTSKSQEGDKFVESGTEESGNGNQEEQDYNEDEEKEEYEDSDYLDEDTSDKSDSSDTTNNEDLVRNGASRKKRRKSRQIKHTSIDTHVRRETLP